MIFSYILLSAMQKLPIPVYQIFPSASREHQAGLSADREGWGQRRLEQKSEGSDQTAAAHHHQGASRCHEAKRWGKIKSLTIIRFDFSYTCNHFCLSDPGGWVVMTQDQRKHVLLPKWNRLKHIALSQAIWELMAQYFACIEVTVGNPVTSHCGVAQRTGYERTDEDAAD